LIAALCLATDLGMGFPFEHGLQTTVIAMRLADRLDVDRETASQTYYACLLSHAGCTTEAHVAAKVFGGSMTTHLNPRMYGSTSDVLSGLLRSLPDPDRAAPVRALQTARRLPRMARGSRPALTAACEVAAMLADQTGAPTSVSGLFAHLTERWDGHGPLRRAKGDQISVPMRIVHVATDAALQRHLGGSGHAVRLVRDRAGHAFDPEVAARLDNWGREILALDESGSVWDEVLALEPSPTLALAGVAMSRALAAMGRFSDLMARLPRCGRGPHQPPHRRSRRPPGRLPEQGVTAPSTRIRVSAGSRSAGLRGSERAVARRCAARRSAPVAGCHGLTVGGECGSIADRLAGRAVHAMSRRSVVRIASMLTPITQAAISGTAV